MNYDIANFNRGHHTKIVFLLYLVISRCHLDESDALKVAKVCNIDLIFF